MITKARYPDRVHSYAQITKRIRKDNNRSAEIVQMPTRIVRRNSNPTMTSPRPGPSTSAGKEKEGIAGARGTNETHREKRNFSSPELERGNKNKISRKEQPRPKNEIKSKVSSKDNIAQRQRTESDPSVSNQSDTIKPIDPPKEQRRVSLIKDFPMPPCSGTHEVNHGKRMGNVTGQNSEKYTVQPDANPIQKDETTNPLTVRITERKEKPLSRDPRLNKNEHHQGLD